MVDTATEVTDRVYASRDGRPMLATIYRPATPAPWPALLEVHGGAWFHNDRLQSVVLASELARRGVMVVSVDFRMPPEHPYPVGLTDINTAIQWLRTRARNLGADPERIGGLGLSSGGHQLMLCCMRPGDPRYAGTADGEAASEPGLAFAVLCYPIVDPLARYRMVCARRIETLIAGHHSYWRDEDEMKEGNPQLILDRGEPVTLPDILILQGTADANVTEDMAVRFATSYRCAGGKADLQLYTGEPHGFVLDRNSPAFSDAVERTVNFAMRATH